MDTTYVKGKEVRGMDLTGKEGKAVGLVLQGDMKAQCYIVIEDGTDEYAFVILRDTGSAEGSVSSVYTASYESTFSEIVPPEVVPMLFPASWAKFQDSYPKISRRMIPSSGNS